MKRKITVIALILAIVTLLSSCGKKTVMTAASFKANIEDLGFSTSDVTATFGTGDTCKKVYKAVSDGSKFSIYFYEFTTPAASMNEYMYLILDYQAGDESSGNNYNRLVYQNAGTYVLISRIDNTIFTLNTPLLYSEEAFAVIEQLKY